MSEFSIDRFQEMPIVGIMRNFTKPQVLKLAEISETVGLKNLEITMNTDGVEDQIRSCVESFGDQLNIGAGTVCNLDLLERALGAGASFIVTPNVDEKVIRRCSELGVPVYAGAFTPTEIELAYRYGATMVKIFPADVLGPSYLKAVRGPLDHIPLMPTGGVTPETMSAWRDAGAKAFGVGGKLYNSGLAQAEDWDSLTKISESFVAAYREL